MLLPITKLSMDMINTIIQDVIPQLDRDSYVVVLRGTYILAGMMFVEANNNGFRAMGTSVQPSRSYAELFVMAEGIKKAAFREMMDAMRLSTIVRELLERITPQADVQDDELFPQILRLLEEYLELTFKQGTMFGEAQAIVTIASIKCLYLNTDPLYRSHTPSYGSYSVLQTPYHKYEYVS